MDYIWTITNAIVILFETFAMVALVLGIYGLTGGEIHVKFIRDIYNLLFTFQEEDDDAYGM